jgi:hypothetical protein
MSRALDRLDDGLEGSVRELRRELNQLEDSLAELRQVIAAERGKAIELPALPLRPLRNVN